MSKATIPQGTRDYSAEVVRKRNYIIQTIKSVFELYGFEPLETPAMENLDTLLGKYGEEGDKLIFKILNNGLGDPKNIEKSKAAFENVLLGKNDRRLTERALKYDLTIPFARYVAMNHGQLTFPFKRYQVQPVWRADRPQKGRYREFYQCDADVVGSTSLLNEVELALIYTHVFQQLHIDVEIKINSRKILTALSELCNAKDKLTDITVAIDKLDKIGIAKVEEELLQRGLNPEQINIIKKYLGISGTSKEKIKQAENLLGHTEAGKQGIEELEFILTYSSEIGRQPITIDFTLARGLNYYTGIIFEVKAQHVQIGSIGGGGRYDDLTGLFGVSDIPGVGISFGIDRIYDVMEELSLFPQEVHRGTQILFFNLGEAESKRAFSLMQELRSGNISCELFHQQSKFDKQFKYAERKNISFAVLIGSRELETNTCTVKDLQSGKQVSVEQSNLAETIRKMKP